MYIPLLVIAITLGLLNVLDILTDITAIALAGISVVELGLFNSISYITYTASLVIGGRWSERGLIRVHIVIAFLSLIAYALTLHAYTVTKEYTVLILCYLVYPISIAFTRTLVYTYVHEVFTSSLWKKALIIRFIMTSTTEALILVSAPQLTGTDVIKITSTVTITAIVVYAVCLLLVREPRLKVERILYRIDLALDYLEVNVKHLLTYTLLSANATYSHKVLRYTKPSSKPRELLLLSLVGFKLGVALMLVPIPLILTSRFNISLYSVLWIYGISRFIVLAALLYEGNSRVKALLYLSEPLLWYYIMNASSTSLIGLFLGLILYINGGVDVALYSLYLEAERGKNTSLYILLGEVASAIGAAISGFFYKTFGLGVTVLVLVCIMPGFLTLVK